MSSNFTLYGAITSLHFERFLVANSNKTNDKMEILNYADKWGRHHTCKKQVYLA